MSDVIVRHKHTPIEDVYNDIFNFHWEDHQEVGLDYFEESILPFELQFTLQKLINNRLIPLLHSYVRFFVNKRRLQKTLGVKPSDNFSQKLLAYIKEKERDPYYSNKDRLTAVLYHRKKPSCLYLEV